jgi:cytochrome c peroxidase
VPTVRNVDKRPDATFVKAYGHNGYFKSLEAIVHFYNTRDVLPTCDEFGTPGVDCWPAPEVALNVNRDELGDLKLSADDESAIVAFLKTLSDGYQP